MYTYMQSYIVNGFHPHTFFHNCFFGDDVSGKLFMGQMQMLRYQILETLRGAHQSTTQKTLHILGTCKSPCKKLYTFTVAQTRDVRFKNKSDSKYENSGQIQAQVRFDQGAETIGPGPNAKLSGMLTGPRAKEPGNLTIGNQIVRFTIKDPVKTASVPVNLLSI